ncbi:hypothetical protein QOL99_14330, partial [Deinococcus sp. MIMF12]
LSNLTQDALGLARTGEADPPLALGQPRRLPGQARPLQLRVSGLPSSPGSGPSTLRLTLDLGTVAAQGRTPREALQVALGPALTLLLRGALIELWVPPGWEREAREAVAGRTGVQVRPEPQEGQGEPE